CFVTSGPRWNEPLEGRGRPGFDAYHVFHASRRIDAMLTGGCHCGFVRYTAAGKPSQETNCHCPICRRTTGAAFVSWFTVKPSEFAFTSGQPARYASSSKAERTFCPRCATQLTFRHVDFPEEVDDDLQSRRP